MKNSRRSLTVGTIIVALAMLAGSTQAQQVTIPTTAAKVPSPASGTAMTTEYVQMVGRMVSWLPAPEGPFSLHIRAYWPELDCGVS